MKRWHIFLDVTVDIFYLHFWTYYMHFCSFLDVYSLKRIGVDCIVHVHCTIWATLHNMGYTATYWHSAKHTAWKAGDRHSDLVRPLPGNDVCGPDMFGVEKLNPAQLSRVQHMVKGIRVIPVRSAPKHPLICAEKRKIVQPSTVKLGLINCQQ